MSVLSLKAWFYLLHYQQRFTASGQMYLNTSEKRKLIHVLNLRYIRIVVKSADIMIIQINESFVSLKILKLRINLSS